MPKELPVEHIANIPAGHKRDEEVRKREDNLTARLEAEANDPDGMQAIDPAKFRKIDNEIANRVGRDGQIRISGMQSGMRYAFVKHAETCSADDAKSAVRFMHDAMRRAGWMYVKESDPEASELKGNDCAAGTSLRGWGDCVLMAIREEYAQAQDQKMQRKTDVAGAVEERTRLLGSQKGLYVEAGAGHFDPNSRLGKFFPGDQGAPVQMQGTFNEGDLRRGSINPAIVNAISGQQFAGPPRR